MSSEKRLTDALNSFIKTKSEDDAALIVRRFEAVARAIVEQTIGKSVAGKISITDVANDVLREALDAALKRTSDYESSKQFTSLLVKIARARSIDAVRDATAAMRDVRRDLNLETVDLNAIAASADLSPPLKAVADEIAVLIAIEILKEPNETKRDIDILGVLYFLNPRQIQEVIEKTSARTIPLSTIRQRIKSTQERLGKLLDSDSFGME